MFFMLDYNKNTFRSFVKKKIGSNLTKMAKNDIRKCLFSSNDALLLQYIKQAKRLFF